MLRLTTNVTVSPASSARSASAAWRMSSTTSGRRVGEQRRQLLRRRARSPSRARSIVPGATRAVAAARHERRVLGADRPRARAAPASLVDVLRVDAQALGEREAVGGEPRAHLRRATGTGARARCGRRWRSGRRGRSRPRAPARATSRRGSAGPGCRRSGISRRVSAISRFMSSIVTSFAHAGRVVLAAPRRSRCASSPRPPRWRSRPAPRRSSGGAGRSSGG